MPIGKICGNCAKKVILFRVHSSHNDGHCVPLSVYEATEKSTSRETSWEKSSHAAHWTLCHTHWREEKEKVQRSWRKLRWKRRRPLWGRAHKFASSGKKINFFFVVLPAIPSRNCASLAGYLHIPHTPGKEGSEISSGMSHYPIIVQEITHTRNLFHKKPCVECSRE